MRRRTHGRADPDRSARRPRCRARVLRPGRELPGGTRRALRHAADPADRWADGGQLRQHGVRPRPADRPSRGLLRQSRAGRRAGVGRGPHRPAGLDPVDHVRRAGAACAPGSRGVSGGRHRCDVRAAGEVDGDDRRSGADSRVRQPRLSGRDRGPARAGRAVAARGRADASRRCSRRGPGAADADPAPSANALARTHELVSAAERPLVVVGGGGWSERAGTDAIAAVRVLGRAVDDRVPLPGLRRQRLAGVLRHARPGDRPTARRAASGSPICCW